MRTSQIMEIIPYVYYGLKGSFTKSKTILEKLNHSNLNWDVITKRDIVILAHKKIKQFTRQVSRYVYKLDLDVGASV